MEKGEKGKENELKGTTTAHKQVCGHVIVALILLLYIADAKECCIVMCMISTGCVLMCLGFCFIFICFEV